MYCYIGKGQDRSDLFYYPSPKFVLEFACFMTIEPAGNRHTYEFGVLNRKSPEFEELRLNSVDECYDEDSLSYLIKAKDPGNFYCKFDRKTQR